MRHYFLLVHSDNKKTFVLKLAKKHYVFLVDNYYFSYKGEGDDFTLEEKLCVLNHSTKCNWKEISPIRAFFSHIFLNTTSPNKLKIIPMNKKITVLVNDKVVRNLIIK